MDQNGFGINLDQIFPLIGGDLNQNFDKSTIGKSGSKFIAKPFCST